jgi:hypothetical protein
MEVLEGRACQFTPSVEVRMFPESPTATKVPLPNATQAKRVFDVPDVRFLQ